MDMSQRRKLSSVFKQKLAGKKGKEKEIRSKALAETEYPLKPSPENRGKRLGRLRFFFSFLPKLGFPRSFLLSNPLQFSFGCDQVSFDMSFLLTVNTLPSSIVFGSNPSFDAMKTS